MSEFSARPEPRTSDGGSSGTFVKAALLKRKNSKYGEIKQDEDQTILR